jgi:hypothetical protein
VVRGVTPGKIFTVSDCIIGTLLHFIHLVVLSGVMEPPCVYLLRFHIYVSFINQTDPHLAPIIDA